MNAYVVSVVMAFLCCSSIASARGIDEELPPAIIDPVPPVREIHKSVFEVMGKEINIEIDNAQGHPSRLSKFTIDGRQIDGKLLDDMEGLISEFSLCLVLTIWSNGEGSWQMVLYGILLNDSKKSGKLSNVAVYFSGEQITKVFVMDDM